ncbi:MAG TPA: hypothetical protein VFW78_03730 [Bacteroidia bacterium]|nr:hypothetical protein [Bacteroidia bacterium]
MSEFVASVQQMVAQTERLFSAAEQELLKQKTFEDMAFCSSGLCENGDFFYFAAVAEGPTARERFSEYMQIKESFDHFAENLYPQLRDINIRNEQQVTAYVHETLEQFKVKLQVLAPF